MDTLWPIVVTFAKDHLATTHNIYMVIGTYVLIWAAEPVIRRVVEGLPKRRQVYWWGIQKSLKNIAAIAWCEILVWVPTVQPELCNGELEGCQTVFGRVMTGVILGGSLSLLHKLVISRLKRIFGMQTKEPKHVTMSRG